MGGGARGAAGARARTSAEALIDATECGVPAEPVTRWSAVDAVALGTLGAYAGMVWGLKEVRANTTLSLVLVGVYLLLVLLLVSALLAFPRADGKRPKVEAQRLLPSLAQLSTF